MDKSCSDCDSNLSLDSLECGNSVVSKSKSPCKNVTIVPYYSGEGIENLKHEVQTSPKSFNCTIPTKVNKVALKSHSTCSDLSNQVKTNGSQSFRPTFTYFADEKPSRAVNVRRISRRTILPEEQTIRPRHKSVSYVEQFRKKICTSKKPQASTLSIVDPEPYQSPSSESCGNRDSGLGTSEFEFCEDILFQPQSTQIDLSLSQMNDESVKSASEKLGKTPTKNKGKTVVLKRVDISGCEISGNKVVEKKSSTERRDEYATKVKLRNQLSFNRQKDRERTDKCLTEKSSHYKDETEVSNTKPSVSAIPFTCPLDVLGNKSDSQKKSKGFRRKSGNQKKKPPVQHENMEIEMLRRRHEQEKQLVNSLRELIIKT